MKKVTLVILAALAIAACTTVVAKDNKPQINSAIIAQVETPTVTSTPTETPVPWIEFETVQRYNGPSDRLLWLIILALVASGTNMDRIEAELNLNQCTPPLCMPIPN